jgi:stage II sporulation protein D
VTLRIPHGWLPRRTPLLPLLALPLAALPLAALPQLLPGGPPTPQPAPTRGPARRVLLSQEGVLSLGARDGTLRLTETGGRTVLELRPGDRLTLRPGPDGSGFEAALMATADPAPRPLLVLPLAELWLTPRREGGGQGLPLLGERAYRGRLQLTSRDGNLRVINHVSLEAYLTGVVGSEMPASWPPDALQAQAVAARTYALAQRRPAAPFDLKATVASQVYGGVAAETASTREAVARTRGQVLMHGGALINAVFHSSSGGSSTENSGEIWSRQLPYLVSVPDFDQSSPVNRWEKSFDPLQLRRVFRETDGVRAIEVLDTSSTGRIRRARILGPAGSLELSGAELRQRLGLRSTLASFRLQPLPSPSLPVSPPAAATISGSLGRLLARNRQPPPLPPPPELGWSDPASGAPMASESTTTTTAAPPLDPLPALFVSGRGFGHGVGMSQWGAQAMALRGSDYRQILRHYYRGAELRSLPSP